MSEDKWFTGMFGIDLGAPPIPSEETRLAFIRRYAEDSVTRLARLEDRGARLWAQSGLRSGEVRALRRGDLDVSAGMVLVQRSWTKGRLGPTKTGRTRLVSVLHPVCEDTSAWQPGSTAESRALMTGLQQLRVTSVEPEGELFGRVLHERWLHGLWRRVLTKTTIRYREVEQIRHTFASTLLSRTPPALRGPARGVEESRRAPQALCPLDAPGDGATGRNPAQPGARKTS